MNTQRWEAYIEQLMAQYHLAGVSVAVTDCSKTLYAKGFGVLSVERPTESATPDTLYRIASLTKITVGLLCMKFKEMGLLDLDAPITNYVSWLSESDFDTVPRITLRRLLSHSAGLPSEYTPDGPHDEDKLEAVLSQAIPKLVPVADPDDRLFYYCNWGIRLVSYVLQQVSGKPFTALVKQYILEPLGMERTCFSLCEAATWALSVPHKVSEKGELSVLHFIPVNATRHAAGGLFSTVNNLTCLARVLLNGGAPIISAESLQEMQTPQCNLYLDYRNEYGLTMWMKEYRGLDLRGHTGASPPYYASLWTCPDKGIGIAVLTNTETGKKATDLIPKFILSDLYDLVDLPQEDGGEYEPEVEKAHVGLYLSDSFGLITLDYEGGKPWLCVKGQRHPLSKHSRKGVYYYEQNGKRTCVGLPGSHGSSTDHLLLDSLLCRKVTLEPSPKTEVLESYVGLYGTVLNRYRFTVCGDTLYIQLGEGERHPCQYVNGETFSCELGVASFVQTDGIISGVRVSSSFVYNRVTTTDL